MCMHGRKPTLESTEAEVLTGQVTEMHRHWCYGGISMFLGPTCNVGDGASEPLAQEAGLRFSNVASCSTVPQYSATDSSSLFFASSGWPCEDEL